MAPAGAEAQERGQRAGSRDGSEMGTGRAPLEEAWMLLMLVQRLVQLLPLPPPHLCLQSSRGSLRHLLCAGCAVGGDPADEEVLAV